MRCPRCGWRFGPNKEFAQAVKEDYPKAFRPWSPEDDQKLAAMVTAKQTLIQMAAELGRQPSAIKRRILALDLDQLNLLPEKPEPTPKDYLDRESSGSSD